MEKHPIACLFCAFGAGIVFTSIFDLGRLRLLFGYNIIAQPDTSRKVSGKLLDTGSSERDKQEVPDGIESCIGNTPLFRIKSLSEATGCDILAKAEVNQWQILSE